MYSTDDKPENHLNDGKCDSVSELQDNSMFLYKTNHTPLDD